MTIRQNLAGISIEFTDRELVLPLIEVDLPTTATKEIDATMIDAVVEESVPSPCQNAGEVVATIAYDPALAVPIGGADEDILITLATGETLDFSGHVTKRGSPKASVDGRPTMAVTIKRNSLAPWQFDQPPSPILDLDPWALYDFSASRVTIVDGVVTGFQDATGNGHHATKIPGTSTVTATTLGGRAALLFPASGTGDQGFRTADSFSVSRVHTLIAVVQHVAHTWSGAPDPSHRIIVTDEADGLSNAYNGGMYWSGGIREAAIRPAYAPATGYGTVVASEGSPHVALTTCYHAGSEVLQMEAFIEDNSQGGAAGPMFDSPNCRWNIGGGAAGAQQFSGIIATVAIFDRVLDAGEKTAAIAALATFYGI